MFTSTNPASIATQRVFRPVRSAPYIYSCWAVTSFHETGESIAVYSQQSMHVPARFHLSVPMRCVQYCQYNHTLCSQPQLVSWVYSWLYEIVVILSHACSQPLKDSWMHGMHCTWADQHSTFVWVFAPVRWLYIARSWHITATRLLHLRRQCIVQ